MTKPSKWQWPEGDRPVNRIREIGPQGLSVGELLSCLLQGDGALEQAAQLYTRFGSLRGLMQATPEELAEVPGVGPVQAARVSAALHLGFRLMAETAEADRWQIRAPSDAAHIMRQIENEERECFMVLVLDTRNRVIRSEILYRGTVNTSVIRPAEVFRLAMRYNGTSIVVGHNHPSGDPTPSPEDVALTRKLVSCGKELDIEVLDHVVVGHSGKYVSLRERSLGFEIS